MSIAHENQPGMLRDRLSTEYDEVVAENRRGDALVETSRDHPDVVFNYSGFGDPWKRAFGAFRDDPYFGRWQESIQSYRRNCDADSADVPEVSVAQAG